MSRSRHHRKNLAPLLLSQKPGLDLIGTQTLWQPQLLNWWIGLLFAVGSLLFVLGCVLTLVPVPPVFSMKGSDLANITFFTGSLPFTTAAYLQLYQAANSFKSQPTRSKETTKPHFMGWYPHDFGWLSSAIQFGGTLLFNINTLDALLPGLDWLQQDLLIWTPDFIGSSMFLISGYLAFKELCQSDQDWKSQELSWQITCVNLLGCIAFMIAATLAFTLPNTSAIIIALSTSFTLVGALAFLFGSLLSMFEARYSIEAQEV